MAKKHLFRRAWKWIRGGVLWQILRSLWRGIVWLYEHRGEGFVAVAAVGGILAAKYRDAAAEWSNLYWFDRFLILVAVALLFCSVVLAVLFVACKVRDFSRSLVANGSMSPADNSQSPDRPVESAERHIEILWKSGEQTYHMYYGKDNLTIHCRICVVNRSETAKITNVQVQLKSLTPHELPCVPCCLRLMNDLTRGDQRFIETFDLKPGESRFVDVMAQDPDDTKLWIWHTVRGIPEVVPAQPYVLTVAVTGDNASGDEKQFQLFKNGPYWNMKGVAS